MLVSTLETQINYSTEDGHIDWNIHCHVRSLTVSAQQLGKALETTKLKSHFSFLSCLSYTTTGN